MAATYLRRLYPGETRRFFSFEPARIFGVGSLVIHFAGLHLAVYWNGVQS